MNIAEVCEIPPSPSKCALCLKEASLQLSHIIPAFVFRWLKTTSGTGYFRYSESPNKRVQDGLKIPLLCESCEQLFSGWERQFAGTAFYPLCGDAGQTIVYAEWLLKFCVSVSWRVLFHLHETGRHAHFNDIQKLLCNEALMRWSDFLLGIKPHPGPFEQHLILFGPIDSHTMHAMPANMNRYMLRGIDLDLACTSNSAFTAAKMGPFVIYGIIQPFEDKWEGTKVHVRKGELGPRRYVLPAQLFEYWQDRAARHAAVSTKISEKQQDKLEADALANVQRFRESGTFAAMLHDVDLSGEEAILRKPKPTPSEKS